MGLPIPEWFDSTQTRDGDGGVTDRATRGACSARSRWAEQCPTSSMGGLQTFRLTNPSPIGSCGFEPRPGWKLPASISLIVHFPPVQERRGLGRSAWQERAGNGKREGRGRGSAVQKASMNNINEQLLLGRPWSPSRSGGDGSTP